MAHYISDAEGKLTQIAGKNYKSYMPLGMIFASAVMLEEISVKRLNGQSLSITGTYKDFCNWVISQGANAPTCNISTYASEMTTYGQCGKFVINNTNTAQTSGSYTVPAYSIKLPTITEFIASNNGGDTIGLAELDEFKSHRHGFKSAGRGGTYTDNYKQIWTATGGSDGSGNPAGLDLYTANEQGVQLTGGEETRPKNIRYPYYIVVAQGVKPIALADMTKKAEKDGSNLTNADVKNWQDKCRFEMVKTIYDKDSTDTSINLGYTSGLTNNTSVTGSFDTENVKCYLVTVRMNAINYCLRYDPNTYADGSYTNSFGQLGYVTFEDSNVGYFYTCSMYITSSKIKVNKLGFWRNSTTLNTNSNFYVSKIEAIY